MSEPLERVRVSILGGTANIFQEMYKIGDALRKAGAGFLTGETCCFQYDTVTAFSADEILPNLRQAFSDSAKYAVYMFQVKTKNCLGQEAHHAVLVCNDFNPNKSLALPSTPDCG